LGLLIDTDVLINLERSDGSLSSLLETFGDEFPAIAAITASEMLHGVHRARGAMRRKRREHFVEAILDVLAVLPFDLATARIHARLWADLQAGGRIIGSHDQLIAATALRHDLTLLTLNQREFRRVEGLRVAGSST
jgi:tRNA(fMet)-specific endonuclease VapC